MLGWNSKCKDSILLLDCRLSEPDIKIIKGWKCHFFFLRERAGSVIGCCLDVKKYGCRTLSFSLFSLGRVEVTQVKACFAFNLKFDLHITVLSIYHPLTYLGVTVSFKSFNHYLPNQYCFLDFPLCYLLSWMESNCVRFFVTS